MRTTLGWCAILAVSLGSMNVAPTSMSDSGGLTGESPASIVQETDSMQAGDAADEAPPIVGLGAMIFFYAFLFVVLIVPTVLAWEAARRTPTVEENVGVPTTVGVFSSDRERQLWLWLLAVIVAIYATLSPVQHLAAELRERNLLRVTSAAVMLAVTAIIVVVWARTHRGRREIGAGLGVIAIYLVTMIRMPIPEARSHLFEYSLVAMLMYHALHERRRNGRRVPVPALLTVVATALLGWLDEAVQWFLPNRVYDLVDVGLNAAFGLMAVLACVFIGLARRLDILNRLARLRS